MPWRLRADSPIGRGGRVAQPQTLSVVLIDFVGDLPLVTLMKARALTVIVEPFLVEAVTLSVCVNGALLSIFTRLEPM